MLSLDSQMKRRLQVYILNVDISFALKYERMNVGK